MVRPFASFESALTPEKVPTAPEAAQAPELSPFEIEMPLPPSTSGSTSQPEITIGLSGLTASLLAAQGSGCDPRSRRKVYQERRKKRKSRPNRIRDARAPGR